MSLFRALVVEKIEARHVVHIKELTIDDLMQGDVTIRVAYSIVSYQDALACMSDGRNAKMYPMVPGSLLSGTVVASGNDRFLEGDEVIVNSNVLGVSHYGGYSSYARVPAEWVAPLPQGLSLSEAITIGPDLLKVDTHDSLVNEILLDELPDCLMDILLGRIRGRTIVKL